MTTLRPTSSSDLFLQLINETLGFSFPVHHPCLLDSRLSKHSLVFVKEFLSFLLQRFLSFSEY